jgi:S1-C subfamily serine protease
MDSTTPDELPEPPAPAVAVDTHELPVPPAQSAPTRRRGVFAPAMAALVMVLVSVGFGIYVGHDVFTPTVSTGPVSSSSKLPFHIFGNQPPSFSLPTPSIARPPAPSPAVAKVAKAVDPGLVDIDTNLTYQGESAAGTGMILTSKGLVLTNNHVIDGATTITAVDVATKKVYKVKVLGYDETQDVALLQLEGASGLSTIKVGNSSALTLGQSVIGIGNAGGVGGTPSVASGKVSALDQTITASDSGGSTPSEQLNGLIESNADIQPGDSGGPLVTAHGYVVGMDTAASSANGGFTFNQTTNPSQSYSIPINTALSIAKSIENGDASSTIHVGATAFLGVEVSSSTTTGEGFQAPSGTSGAVIQQVLSGTPAAQSTLVAGDVITSLNGQTVTDASALGAMLQGDAPGSSVQIGYVTQNAVTGTVTITLASGPPQ